MRELRETAKRLLERREVGVVIGYEVVNEKRARPVFITRPEDAKRLGFNRYCVHNLSVYLQKRHDARENLFSYGKQAVVAKGCDIKAMVVLIQENQIRREDVYIIGMACEGVMNEDTLLDKCKGCDVRTPHLYDVLIGKRLESTKENILDKKIEEMKKLSEKDRFKFWKEQFSRCIRCYACRQVCPLCTCSECIAERTMPQWIEKPSHLRGNFAWNIIRAFHLAGRCIECGECERVCPVRIPLMLLNHTLNREIEEKFSYRPGYSYEEPPPLLTYKEDDKEEFIK